VDQSGGFESHADGVGRRNSLELRRRGRYLWTSVNTIGDLDNSTRWPCDNEKPYHICGGLQDTGAWCGPSQTLTRDGHVE